MGDSEVPPTRLQCNLNVPGKLDLSLSRSDIGATSSNSKVQGQKYWFMLVKILTNSNDLRSDGPNPKSDGLQPNSDGVQPTSDEWFESEIH